MTESKTPKMNLDHERKIAELQERVNRLENLCFTAKEVLNLEEASAFLGIAKVPLQDDASEPAALFQTGRQTHFL